MPERQKIGKSQNIVKISLRPKSSKQSQRNLIDGSKREVVEIKNRALYDTDTESERMFKAPYAKGIDSTFQPHQMYSDVVNELKSLPALELQKHPDSDLDDLNKNEDPQKGVLKSFPSVGSLSKKKVLFDLNNDSIKREGEIVIPKTEGSTTSIASSILEHGMQDADNLIKCEINHDTKNKEKDDVRKKENEFKDSDFDFSDS